MVPNFEHGVRFGQIKLPKKILFRKKNLKKTFSPVEKILKKQFFTQCFKKNHFFWNIFSFQVLDVTKHRAQKSGVHGLGLNIYKYCGTSFLTSFLPTEKCLTNQIEVRFSSFYPNLYHNIYRDLNQKHLFLTSIYIIPYTVFISAHALIGTFCHFCQIFKKNTAKNTN